MKNFRKILWVLVVLLMLPAILLGVGAAQPSYYQEAYYAELAQMYDRLYTTQGKKLVILGGSNVAFGLDGAALEQTLRDRGYDYTVCPFGLYAAVGTSAMLELSADALGEGDIVVLAFEPGEETLSTYFGATAFWKCAEEKPEMLLKLSGTKVSALVGNYVPYLQERVSITLNGNPPMAEGVYARSSFNDRCDLIYERPGNIMPVGYDSATPIDLENVTIAPDFLAQVNDYCAAAAERGAQVVMSFSPMNRSAIRDKSEEAVYAYFTQCNQGFNCPIISDPNDYILASGWFYDSNFHMNDAGTTLRTNLLAQDVLAYLGFYGALDLETPEMPGNVATEPLEETPTEGFEFEPVLDGEATVAYRISGLTDAALLETSLTVPRAHEGKPVVGFTADALAQAEKLVELRLPDSIESLPDGLFASCKALTTLVLEHLESPCAVTEHTFDGADQLRIYIPAQAYALYRDGAGCATNPWSQYLDRLEQY